MLSVLDSVVAYYKDDIAAERAASGGQSSLRSEEKYAKVLKVREAALRVIGLTKTLIGVKMCLTETVTRVLEAQSRGVEAERGVLRDWQDVLVASPRYRDVLNLLWQGETVDLRHLGREERLKLLHGKVKEVSKELEAQLERMMDIDELVGTRQVIGEEDDDEIKRECFLIAGICCRHVVGSLGDGESS